MATIPVYLTDDNGNLIEQTSGSGDYIIVGYVNQTLFANTSGELYTTFYDVVQAATPEQKAEVLRGLRLAKGIRGDLRRFELSGSDGNAYVKYNHCIFGGRYRSQYTALGSIAGTYLRRGGSAFTKELVEAALVSGPYANFSNFPSGPVLPGDVTFQVNAGGGTVSAYAWSITDGTTTFNPTGASVTETLTEGTWTVSCVVTIDSSPVVVAGQTLEVALFTAASMAPDNPTPALNDTVTFSLSGMQNPSLAQSSEWTFSSAPTVTEYDESSSDLSFRNIFTSVDVPLIEDVDYEVVSQAATSISVRFLTGGEFHVDATVRHSDNTVAVAFSSVDVTPTGSFGTLTNNSRMSTATADAIYSGDTHMIILGDSLMNYGNPERLAYGLRNNWKPARWAGLQHAGNSQGGGSGLAIVKSGSQSAPAEGSQINRDGTNSSGAQVMGTEVATAQYTPLTLKRGEYSLSAASLSNAVRLRAQSSADPLAAIGRLQTGNGFLDVAGARSDMLLVGVDTGLTLGVISPGTVEASSVTLTADEYQVVSTTWNPTGADDQDCLAVEWSGQTVGAKFGVIDAYTYNPNVSGLSVSYMGDGGWNIANHAGPYALNESGATDTSTHANPGEWYDDRAIEQHLKIYAYKDYAQTTLRDNVVILIENQNDTPYGYTNAVRLALNAIRSRWETAANNVDPSGDLWSRIQFVYLTLPEVFYDESHASFAAQARDFIGVGGYDWCELIDLNQQLAEYAPGDGLDYSDPRTYTDVYINNVLNREADLANGSEWYIDNDMVHPVAPGSNVMMSEFWKIIENSSSASQLVSGTVTAEPTFSQTGEAIEFDVDGITGDTDRVIVWLDQNGTEVARGENPTLSNLSSSVTRVDARIITADGADVTLVGPAIQINNAPTIDSQLAIDGGVQPVEGASYDLVITASDVNGDDLTYSLSDGNGAPIIVGPLASGTEASFTLTAGTAGISTNYTCTVTDGNGGSVTSSSVAVTPTSANSSPIITSFTDSTSGPYAAGDAISLLGTTITDPDGDPMTYTITYTLDGVSQGNIDTLSPLSGNVTSGTATGTHTAAAAGNYVFTIRVEDGNGGFDEETFAATVAAAPSDPFGTPDYVVDLTSYVDGQTTFTNYTNVTDSIGLIDELIINRWNSGRAKLYHARVTDRNTMGTYLSNNPNAVFVFEIDGTTTIYYKYGATKEGDALSFPSAFDDLRAADGWFEEDGTAISGVGPVPTSIVGSDVRMSIYPTDET